MEKNHLIPKIYGYAVCLVSVIVTLIAVGNIVSAAFDRIDPTNVHNYNYSTSANDVSSFEAYKASYQANQNAPTGEKISTSPVLTEEQLRDNYEAARDSQIRSVKVGSAKSMTMYGSLLLLVIILFVTNWRWLRKLDK
jgi:hypothetical protein